MENNTQANVTKIASFSTANNLDDAISLGYNILDEIFKTNPSASKIVVSVSATDDGGSYSHTDLYVYDSYTNALGRINSLEYSHNTAVDVIEVNVKGYSHIFYKCFDGVCYSRLAQVDFQPWDIFKARQLWDVSADIYTVTYELNK
jgi:hypothetical protein